MLRTSWIFAEVDILDKFFLGHPVNLCQHYFQDTDDDDADLPEVPWLERQVRHLECGIIVLFCLLRGITKLNEWTFKIQ